MSDKHLKEDPIFFADNAWYYEEKDGISIVVDGVGVLKLKIANIRAYLRRLEKP